MDGSSFPSLSACLTHACALTADVHTGLAQREGFALRHGHMYAYRLMTALQLPDINDGVVRVSLLHYNTPAEVQGLIKALSTVLPADAQ